MMHKQQSKSASDSAISKGFGGRLRQLRERIGLSVPKFATAVGFDRTYVYRLENEQADNPSLKFLEAVVSQFGVDREWLFGGTGDAASLRININPARTGLDAYVQMRLECLEHIVETYTPEELQSALDRLNELAKSDPKFGKLFGEVANVVAYSMLRKQQRLARVDESATVSKSKSLDVSIEFVTSKKRTKCDPA